MARPRPLPFVALQRSHGPPSSCAVHTAGATMEQPDPVDLAFCSRRSTITRQRCGLRRQIASQSAEQHVEHQQHIGLERELQQVFG